MDKLNAVLQAHVADGDDTKNKLLGASFVLSNRDGVMWSGSAGRSRMDPSSRSFGTDTFTWIASASKLITTTCVMQIVEQGKIGLDDDVRPLVPELAAMQILRGFEGDEPILEDNTRPITFRTLLTHTLGLPYDIGDPDIVKWSQLNNRTDWAMTWNRNGFNTPIRFAPGDGWLYGPAIDWAGFVLEKITGVTLGAYMQTKIFDKLDMRDTGFWPEKLPQTEDRAVEPVQRVAEGEKAGKLEGVPQWTPVEHEIESGGAGLYGTAGDYAKFQRAYLAGELLSKKTMDMVFTPQLNEKQKTSLETIAYESGEEVRLGFAPEFPKGFPLSHGLSGILNLEDVEGKRKKESITWSGMVNSRWWVDRETGIAGILVVHLMPFGDKVVAELYDQLERGVYGVLNGKAS